MVKLITIGESQETGGSGEVTLDVQSLIYSRALIQANSGGGKSGLMRVIAEQVAATVPSIIIDKEGEYHTLREKVDVVLVGEQGEISADVRSARLLARKLIELGASAVIDLSGFRKSEPQQEFVRDFLDSLINLPRSLWHPTFIMIDEAHFFAPEKGMGESVATSAVVNLMTLGRKRGFCGILATQRLSKLHKNAADVNNVFIGRTYLDLDQKRSARELGMAPSDAIVLRDCPKQHFYAFGADLNFAGVAQFRVSDCQTTIPKPGDRASLTPPKASHVVTEIAEKLKDLPQQADAEIKSLAEAKTRVRELERELKKLESGAPVVDPKVVERAVTQAVAEAEKRFAATQRENAKALSTLTERLSKIASLATLNGNAPALADYKPVAQQANTKAPAVMVRQSAPAKPTAQVTDQSLTGPEQRILDAIAWLESLGITEPNQVAVAFLAGYTFGGGAFNNPRGSLRTKGLVEYVGSLQIKLTSEGRARARFPDEELDSDKLQQRVLNRLPTPEQRILNVLLEEYPNAISKEECAPRAGYTAGAGAFNNPCGRLRSLGLAEYPQPGYVKAADVLFV